MARVVLVKQGGVHTVFQIEAGVGLNRPNNKGDVALVQFFLEQSRSEWGGGLGVQMDGICGRTTITAILEFQNAVNRRYNMPLVATDSAVDPLRTLPVSEGSRSTLGQLHLFLLRAMPARAYYPFIHKLDSFKAELVPELFRL
jgi:hypothetical protein